jgi:hypothetical protein
MGGEMASEKMREAMKEAERIVSDLLDHDPEEMPAFVLPSLGELRLGPVKVTTDMGWARIVDTYSIGAEYPDGTVDVDVDRRVLASGDVVDIDVTIGFAPSGPSSSGTT